jgi:uncharacterized protein YlxW (UPF0749 family)
MNELATAADWTQLPVLIAFIAMIATRVWQSREVTTLRSLVKKIEEEMFEEQRRHNATKRRVKMLQDELDEYRSEDEEEATEGASEQGDGQGET